jgi:hypothetical protein
MYVVLSIEIMEQERLDVAKNLLQVPDSRAVTMEIDQP